MEDVYRVYVVEQMRPSMEGLVRMAIIAGQSVSCSHEEIKERLISAVGEDPDITVVASEFQISEENARALVIDLATKILEELLA